MGVQHNGGLEGQTDKATKHQGSGPVRKPALGSSERLAELQRYNGVP